MPRVNLYEDKTPDYIRGNISRHGMKLKTVYEGLRMPKQRFFRRLRNTDDITLGELRQMVRFCGWTDAELLDVLHADREG